MYSATFIFAKGVFDDAFFALDAEIAALAKSIPGYLGEEAWENPATGLISNVYYWETLEALQTLIKHPAQVVRIYGDGGIAHPLGHHTGTGHCL
ncbi:antibiotic biosynthesis monooxygenase [Rhodoferax sp. GW822-FHT02A01]|uniref:antibiotic biosynthesis monooxygenase family protein n=1 Tax=Rhodoferax sp. GW822-FHT02A01 TaxID=3141537 RepID=UPI00315DEB16